MTQKEELQRARKEAWSRKGDESGLSYIGSIKEGNKIFVFYKGSDGRYWYETKFQEEHGIVSEFEHIFGHREERGRKNAKWKNYKG